MRSSRGPATPPTRAAAPDSPRRPARDIIDAVVDNMRKNLEPLKYSTLAPSRYTVYLHPAEFARLEGIVPILQEQTARALTEELGQLNRRSRAAALGRPLASARRARDSERRRASGRSSSCPTRTATWPRATSSSIPS